MLRLDTLQLTARPAGGAFQPVVWSVEGGDVNGTVSAEGVYRSPGTPGTYQVRCALRDNPSIYALATVAVANSVSLGIQASSAKDRFLPSAKVPFVLSVQGQGKDAVRWTASGGSIASDGTFTAPATPGVFTVTCTSLKDTTKSSTATVVVSDTTVVRLEITGRGYVYVRMATAQAPRTAANFISLAGSGFYNGVYFHRYGPDEGQPKFIQGGDPLTKTLPLTDPSIGTGGPGYTINFEANSLKHLTGAIAMARAADPNSAGSQFYICDEDIPAFDGNYVVFGNVIGGLPIVQQLRKGDKITTAQVLD